MEKEFVTYEQALALKELGFDEPCFTHYLKKILLNNLVTVDTINSKFDNSRCSAPLYQQAFRFFREKYNLSGLPTHQSYEIWNLVTNECFIEVYPLNSFRESELACLNKLIEIVGKAKQG